MAGVYNVSPGNVGVVAARTPAPPVQGQGQRPTTPQQNGYTPAGQTQTNAGLNFSGIPTSTQQTIGPNVGGGQLNTPSSTAGGGQTNPMMTPSPAATSMNTSAPASTASTGSSNGLPAAPSGYQWITGSNGSQLAPVGTQTFNSAGQATTAGIGNPFSAGTPVAYTSYANGKTTGGPGWTGADNNAVPTLSTVNGSVLGGQVIPGSQWVTGGNTTLQGANGPVTLGASNPMPQLAATQQGNSNSMTTPGSAGQGVAQQQQQPTQLSNYAQSMSGSQNQQQPLGQQQQSNQPLAGWQNQQNQNPFSYANLTNGGPGSLFSNYGNPMGGNPFATMTGQLSNPLMSAASMNGGQTQLSTVAQIMNNLYGMQGSNSQQNIYNTANPWGSGGANSGLYYPQLP